MPDTVSQTSDTRNRRDEEKEKRRQDILDAAERVITKHGWEDTDFGKVATRARLSRSLVYFYFPNRDDLFHAVCGRAMADLERRFTSVLTMHKTGLDQATALGRAYYTFAQEQPLYFDLIAKFQGRELNPEDQSDNEIQAHEYGRGCLGLVGRALANGLADGSVSKGIGDPRPTAVAIWAFTHGLIQIATNKESMLQQDFQMGTHAMMEHGFALLRSSLAATKAR